MENNVEVRSITSAIKALMINVDKSSFTFTEKSALKTLLYHLYTYYVDKFNEIKNNSFLDKKEYKDAVLTSKMISYIVTINDTLDGKNNVFDVIDIIEKEIGNQKNNKIKKKN